MHQDTIEKKIREIASSIIHYNSESNNLYSGSAGVALFLFNAIKYGLYDDDQDQLYRLINHCVSTENNYSTLSYGKAGVNWFISYLYKNSAIDDSFSRSITEDNLLLSECAMMYMNDHNYDLLHGGLGIIYNILYDDVPYNCALFENFNLKIKSICKSNKKYSVPYVYEHSKKCRSNTKVNLGLSHGITSILKYFIECYKKNINSEIAKKISYDIIDYIIINQNDTDVCSFFPNSVSRNKRKSQYSRLAWCYGDLGIAFTLYQAGIIFFDKNLREHALMVMKKSTERRSFSETHVSDACICHGSAGIAYIYNKIWLYTNDVIFKEACDFWIQKTLDFGVYKDGIGGYKNYDVSRRKYMNEFGLLEGSAGIGLVLISYITGDFNWDYCLMLND